MVFGPVPPTEQWGYGSVHPWNPLGFHIKMPGTYVNNPPMDMVFHR